MHTAFLKTPILGDSVDNYEKMKNVQAISDISEPVFGETSPIFLGEFDHF